jgi:hypothetical protein
MIDYKLLNPAHSLMIARFPHGAAGCQGKMQKAEIVKSGNLTSDL